MEIHLFWTTKIEDVTRKFNSHLENKILICVNELDTNGEKMKSAFNKMKTLITDNKQSIERKGVDVINVLDCSNYVMTINHAFISKNLTEDMPCLI